MQPQEQTATIHQPFGSRAPVPTDPTLQHPQTQLLSVPVLAQKMDLGGSAASPPGAPFNSGKVFLMTGVSMLATLVIIPIWNSTALLHDATFTYMSGSVLPSLIIAACIFVSVTYAVTVAVFFRTSRPEVQTEQTILTIGSLFLALLGVLLLVLSTPLHQSAETGYHGIWDNCQFGAPRGLFDASQALHALRATPGCAGRQSIEECSGYQPTEAALTLKAMESAFRCSGFCYRPLPAAANTSASEPSSEVASMMQTQSRTVRVGATEGIPCEGEEASLMQMLTLGAFERTSRAHQEPLPAPDFTAYPPTLFSQANFQASCDGMAARNMRNFAGDVADQTFYEGVMLLIVSIIISVMKLATFFETPHLPMKRGHSQGYGSMPPIMQQQPPVMQQHT